MGSRRKYARCSKQLHLIYTNNIFGSCILLFFSVYFSYNMHEPGLQEDVLVAIGGGDVSTPPPHRRQSCLQARTSHDFNYFMSV